MGRSARRMAGQCGEKVEGETTMDDALIPLKHQDEIFKLRKKLMDLHLYKEIHY